MRSDTCAILSSDAWEKGLTSQMSVHALSSSLFLSVVLCLCSGDLLPGQGDLAGAGVSHDTLDGATLLHAVSDWGIETLRSTMMV